MRMNPDMDDDEKGKLFVGGLSWETSQENLQRYFSRYGEVIDCVVMKNSESGRSRGFGFVTFAEPSLVNVVLQNGPHQLDGRTIDPKPCNPRTLQKPKRGGGYPKVFLGGLPSNITETDLRVFFGRYGKVMEVVIMYDQEKKKSRGFGFLSFEDEMSVERVTQEHFINLNGKQVEIKRAEPRDGSGKLGSGSGGMGGGGMSAPGDAPQAGQWGPPAAAPINMIQGHNGQMGGPPINMPMAGPNIMQGYQGWGTSPGQTSYAGYGAAGAGAGPGNYQGWGAPPAPQAPPHAPAWPATNNYTQHTQPPAQGYGSYGSYVPLSEGGEMYGRGGAGGGAAQPPLSAALSSAALSKSSSADYSTYQQYPPAYQQDQGSSYGGSRYAGEYHAPASQPPGDDYEYTGGSGDGYQRSSKRSYHGATSGGAASASSYHPYRR
ncbi:heterogeneous nuclear ribonucleoprotein 27C isoform X3 [Ostrinia furnacalis]|uniref:heterogeneous nuclear ribonucleoprotein 27C isoform X1 n=1 Tax=Ostrinia furnacalis TaxID=93504 RepID=UPI00103B56B1|nr:heterogeneous nuclear ribonucleoprotein 27C isoform X1 [Ostrinia furnacalis]XP_028170044.1 heterogeneous nuclear ribonucleoprotein 27C isoform X2 [Ostrinia furnacalis]XP_028170045.1 heterogeneous nuclear ribonucleoprotein 27C isoform X3 [Ostrinia furnacalis]